MRLVLGLAMALLATSVSAQPRPSTVDRSCAASRQSIVASGAIVLGTGGQTYDRFVRDRSFCQHGEAAEPAFVPARDKQACFVGYRCKDPSRFWD